MTRRVITDDLRFNPETGLYRREDGAEVALAHDAGRDLWLSPDGAEYVQNLNRIADPVYVRIDGEIWRTRVSGTVFSIDWNAFDLPAWLLPELKAVLIQRLRVRYRRELAKMRTMLAALQDMSPAAFDGHASLGDFTAAELAAVMLGLQPVSAEYAGYFRSLYADLEGMGHPGCTAEKLEQLRQYRLSSRTALADVRAWDPGSGALTTSELEVLRGNLLPPPQPETDTEHFSRVLLRALTALGRRPAQMLAVPADRIFRRPQDPGLPAVVYVPGAKAQRNGAPRPYDLPDDLYDDLMRFAERPAIREAQAHLGLFFVTPLTHQTRVAGPKAAGECTVLLQNWIERVGIISPRTGKPLHVTPTRLRHTVATQLARKGWSKADIREFLEHYSDDAVEAYIDAVGNDMTPALERADRALGGVFSDLASSFQGKVVPRPAGKIDKPVIVPDLENRAIIGQCGRTGTCPHSPFAACLAGCAHFLFFRDADVDAAEDFLRGEHERWRQAEGNAQRTRIQDDFARIHAGLRAAGIAAGMEDG
ncbi:tyrosine-type recombinase/integrase [Poseidonocella sp. HB161398]|uniref:tyrosine-type recombinase/integrase n=1 Tax=Poseidonocella sp. HB161398 TaxID=2320855 RepID=UPI001108A903|nr:tyrosine-type recombinase/integrase [Poseidonocella sp. HB161398]